MKKIFGLVLVSAFLFVGCSKQAETTMKSEESAPVAESTDTKPADNIAVGEPTPGTDDAMMKEGAIKEFTVTGTDFDFDVKEIKVKEGDTVKIVFKNTEGFHDWKVDEFDAATKQIPAGKEETITFVANKKGTFEYYCSVGQHRKNGMVGNLIVE